MKEKFQTPKVIAVSLAHLIHDVYGSFLAPMLPLLVDKLGITLSMAGLLDSIRNSPALANPFFGLLIDRVSVKYFVILSPVVTTVVMSLIGLAPTYTVIVVMILVMGISSTLFHVPAPVLIRRLSADKIGTGMSFYMLGGEISRTLGPLIITGAISLWGLEGTWRLIPFGLTASLVLYFFLKDYQGDRYSSADSRDLETKTAFKTLVPLFSTICGYLIFMTAIKVAVTLYLPAYLVHSGKTLVRASFMLSILQFSGAVGTFFAGSISDKIGRKTILYISGFACPLFMWLFITLDDIFMIPILIALGFFLFAYNPVMLALIQGADHHSPSFVNGVYMTFTFLTRTLLVFLVGFNIEHIGYELTYKIAAIAGIGVLPFIHFIPDKKARTLSH